MQADISISGIITPDIELPDGASTYEYTFQVIFKPYEGRGPNKNKFAKYRFGLSDEDVTNGGNSGNIGDATPVTDLDQYMQSSIKFSQSQSTPSQKSFTLGYYSHNYQKDVGFDPGTNNTAHTLIGEFTVTLDANALRAKLQQKPNFKLQFWVIGQDTSGDMAKSSIGGQTQLITVKQVASVKISHLRDISLSNDSTSAKMPFCVYVSQSPYEYALTGIKGKKDPAYQLESGDGRTIDYEVAFANTEAGLNSATYHSTSTPFDYIGPLNGSSDINCNGGHSAAIGINIPQANLPTQDGVYTDTLTVTVEVY